MESTNENELPDRVAEMFKGRTIFMTGGTGFLGKVIIEKFLRVLPETKHLYLLVRPKKGVDPKNRLEEMFSSPVRFLSLLKSKKNIESN